jgi:hypothetical protein
LELALKEMGVDSLIDRGEEEPYDKYIATSGLDFADERACRETYFKERMYEKTVFDTGYCRGQGYRLQTDPFGKIAHSA